MNSFTYARAGNIAEALRLGSTHQAKYLGGGTNLVGGGTNLMGSTNLVGETNGSLTSTNAVSQKGATNSASTKPPPPPKPKSWWQRLLEWLGI